MNVILKLNAGDLVKSLAGNTDDPNFQKAIQAASKSTSQGNYIDQFVAEYKKLSPGVNLAVVFGSGDLRDQINPSTTEDKVIELLKEKYNSAVEASFNVLSTRIDRFGASLLTSSVSRVRVVSSSSSLVSRILSVYANFCSVVLTSSSGAPIPLMK